MKYYVYNNASEALPRLLGDVMTYGDEVGSREGERVRELLHPHIELTHPEHREILTQGRRASLPAQIAETMWVLSGRDDIGWLSHYLPRAAQFSDDGKTWRGAYGPRIRAWSRRQASGDVIDQLAYVVEELRSNPLSRRALITLFDPVTDTAPGKDVPCNNWVHFTSRLGKLDVHIATRSNDLMWGWSGINAFEWSALQEIVAGLLGIQVGAMHFSITSLHVYDRHWKRARDIAQAGQQPGVWSRPEPSPGFNPEVVAFSLDRFDGLMAEWFDIEQAIRTDPEGFDMDAVHAFPEPMLRSWLRVIAWWWTEDEWWLGGELLGTALEHAALATPLPARPTPDAFTKFVTELHEQKHDAYGDSWKRRGEMIGILANIARKVDRLGVAGGGDTAADTGIDLLVYLVKYRLWLADMHKAKVPAAVRDMPTPLSDEAVHVTRMLESLPTYHGLAPGLVDAITAEFEVLEQAAESRDSADVRAGITDTLIGDANALARHLFHQEQAEEQRKAEWKAANEARVWKGYDQ